MARIVRRSVDTSIESNIVTASIISTHFLEEIYPLYDNQYMTSSFTKLLMKWIMDYYHDFGEAPKNHIQDMFTIEKQKMDDADIELVQAFLEQLNNRYIEDQGINDEYVLDQAMQYFRKREIEVRVNNAQALLQIGKLEKAEDELTQMKKVMRLTSNWGNPFTTDSVNDVFDEKNKGILTFPGELGKLLGPLERGWFVAWLAPFKRGKTWMLQEAVVIGALCGLKGVFISLEMQKKSIDERIYKRITAYGEAGKTHIVPVFDCFNNQLGRCTRPECMGSGPLSDSKDTIPDYSPEIEHVVCTVCKGVPGGQFDMSTWFEPVEKPEFNARNVNKKVKAFARVYGQNIRTKCYPRFSAGVADIKRDLDILEQTEGFIPDIIAIDYADILKAPTSDRQGIDDIWKLLAALAAERHLILFSASQGNRGSIYKDNMDQADLAEWIGKLGHVDIFGALNQTKVEKKKGILRAALLAHRHKDFHEDENVTMLQALSLGQTHLDSHI